MTFDVGDAKDFEGVKAESMITLDEFVFPWLFPPVWENERTNCMKFAFTCACCDKRFRREAQFPDDRLLARGTLYQPDPSRLGLTSILIVSQCGHEETLCNRCAAIVLYDALGILTGLKKGEEWDVTEESI